MSDMIDRLHEIATDAGADASEHLSEQGVQARLASQVRQGARRRRIAAIGVTAAVVALGAATAIVAPRLFAPPPVTPVGDPIVPIETADGLITFSDGSMQAVTTNGAVVKVPAGGENAPVFAGQSSKALCATDTSEFTPGWTPQFDDAFDLVTFARPLVVSAEGHAVAAQGQRVALPQQLAKAGFALSVDVDAAAAPNMVMALATYTLAPDGTVAYYNSWLDSEPALDFSGSQEAGTYTATLTSRKSGQLGQCSGLAMKPDLAAPGGAVNYLVATVFLNDGHGQTNPIATHTSWITLTEEHE